jgi:hypothetical protein
MLFNLSIALRLRHDLLRSLRLHIARGLVRHGYPWVPTDQAHGRPRQVGPAYKKTRRLVSVPGRPSWQPTRPPEDLSEDPLDDLVHHDLKTWRTRQDKISVDFAQSRSTGYGKSCNQLDLGFAVVTDLNSGPPTLSVSQYKAGKGVLPGTTSRPSTGRHVILPHQQYKPKNWT